MYFDPEADMDTNLEAMTSAIENVTSGGLGNYVADVYKAYFDKNSDVTNSQQSGIILS